MVGTFYQSPSPEADPYIQVGDKIENDTIVCILEAMKLKCPVYYLNRNVYYNKNNHSFLKSYMTW